jgi:hypothetical protein
VYGGYWEEKRSTDARRRCQGRMIIMILGDIRREKSKKVEKVLGGK